MDLTDTDVTYYLSVLKAKLGKNKDILKRGQQRREKPKDINDTYTDRLIQKLDKYPHKPSRRTINNKYL